LTPIFQQRERDFNVKGTEMLKPFIHAVTTWEQRHALRQIKKDIFNQRLKWRGFGREVAKIKAENGQNMASWIELFTILDKQARLSSEAKQLD
jgi:hypothetical protein